MKAEKCDGFGRAFDERRTAEHREDLGRVEGPESGPIEWVGGTGKTRTPSAWGPGPSPFEHSGGTAFSPRASLRCRAQTARARRSHGRPSRFEQFRERRVAHLEPRAERPCRAPRQRVSCLRGTRNRVSPPTRVAGRLCGHDLQSGQGAARRASPRRVGAFGKGQGFFSGASRTYAITEIDGAQTGAQVKFSLLGARLFLRRPLGELGDALVDLSQAFGRGAAELGERVADARSQEGRLQLLSRAVEMRLRSEDAIPPGLAFAFPSARPS